MQMYLEIIVVLFQGFRKKEYEHRKVSFVFKVFSYLDLRLPL